MSSTAEKTDPALWEKMKDEITAGDKGGAKGEWSARKAQMAVQAYKQAGGGYKGRKDAHNHLAEWTKEDLGYQVGQEVRRHPRTLSAQGSARPPDRRRVQGHHRQEARRHEEGQAVLRPTEGRREEDCALSPRRWRVDQGGALRRGEAARHPGPVDDEQGGAGEGTEEVAAPSPFPPAARAGPFPLPAGEGGSGEAAEG